MLKILSVPAFSDNYIWLFHAESSNAAYVVDPGDATPVKKALTDRGLTLAGILLTHHHMDHIGGVNELLDQYDVPVYGPSSPNIPQVTHTLDDGDVLSLEQAGSDFEVIAVPGHTLDHIAYFSAPEKVLFSGDTLFAGGCGRMFEGNPHQMHSSLSRLSDLPNDTLVYCAHEYTQANLRFALAVEPNSIAIQQRMDDVVALRAEGRITIPSKLGLEKQTNPFLRCSEADVMAAASQKEDIQVQRPEDVFATIRQWKDNF